MSMRLESGGSLLLEGGGKVLLEYPWPDDIPGRTMYYLSNSRGSDTNTGLSPLQALKSIPGLLAKSFGFAAIAVSFMSDDTFACPPGLDLAAPPGVASCVFQGRVDIDAVVDHYPAETVTLGSALPIIIGSWSAGPNTSFKGLNLQAGANWYGLQTPGPFVEVSYCKIIGAGYSANVNGHDVNIHHCTLGGATPAFPGTIGVDANYGSYNVKIQYNDIGNMGGNASNPTQTGFAVYTNGVYDPVNGTTPFPWTYDASGKPTNANIDISYNWCHDCAGNLTSGWAGSASLIELGNGNHQHVYKNKCENIYPRIAWYGGYDMVGIDPDINAIDSIVELNLCVNCFGPGIEDFSSGAPGWGPCIIRYNLSINCGWGNEGNFGPQGKNTTGTHYVYGNTNVTTIGNGGQNPPANVAITSMASAVLALANNIAVTTDAGLYQAYADFMPSVGCTATHNCWHGPGPFYWGGTTFANYAAWAASGLPGVDANGITGDPMFVGTAGSTTWTDYALQSGSPCIGTGVDVFTAFGIPRGWEYFNGVPVVADATNMGCMG